MNKRQGRRVRSRRRRTKRHNRSVLVISMILLLLVVMVSYNGMTLRAKEANLKAKETELEAQLEEEKARVKEIEELEQYVGTDEYVEQVAKEKLGLVGEDEIIFKAE